MTDYRKVWTLVRVGSGYDTILAPASDGGSGVRHSWRRGTSGSVSARTRGVNESYGFAQLPKQMAVVLGASEAERTELVRNVKNCLVSDWNGKLTDTQLHLWPLDYWPYFQGLYYGEDFKLMDLTGPEMWVGGEKVDFESMCRACPNYLEQALDMCRPCTIKCTIGKAPFLQQHSGWFEKHRPDWKYLEQQKTFQFMEHGKLSVQDVFEKADFDTLSNNEAEWNSIHETRSERSRLAAATVRHQKNVCDGCLVKSSWCSTQGGAGCKEGPFLPEDYEPLAASCEPWMFWALDVSLRHQGVDLRGEVRGWYGTRLSPQSVIGPTNRSLDGEWGDYKKDNMNVRVARSGKRTLELATAPLRLVCERMGLPFKTTWPEILDRFEPGDLVARVGRPIPSYLLAAARLLFSGDVESYHKPYGWGTTYLYLNELVLSGSALRFEYRTEHGHSWSYRVENLEGCFHLEGAGRSHAELVPDREFENKSLKQYVHTDRLPLTLTRWRQLLREHPEWRQAKPEAAVLRKLLRQERAEALKKARAEEAAAKAAEAKTEAKVRRKRRKLEQETKKKEAVQAAGD